MLIGCSFDELNPLENYSDYDIASSFCAFKPDSVIEESLELNFDRADRFIEICQRQGLEPRGHCLLWHCDFPYWFKELPIDYEPILKNYVQSTVARYPQVRTWDVINEAFADNGQFRESLIIPYLEKAFYWAHEANPDAQLLINDYRPMLKDKWDSILAWCDRSRAKGVPIHGIGIQHHHHLRKILVESVAGWKASKEVIRRVVSRGLICEITEVSIVEDVPRSDKLIRDFYTSLENIARSEGAYSFTYWNGALYKYRPSKELTTIVVS